VAIEAIEEEGSCVEVGGEIRGGEARKVAADADADADDGGGGRGRGGGGLRFAAYPTSESKGLAADTPVWIMDGQGNVSLRAGYYWEEDGVRDMEAVVEAWIEVLDKDKFAVCWDHRLVREEGEGEGEGRLVTLRVC
jgi:hypothetical protein